MTFTTAFLATALVVPSMPPPEFADCEVVTNCVFDVSRGDAKMFAVKIELDATSSNGVEVYFTGSVVYRRGSLAVITPYGIVIGKRNVRTTTLAHELGHALGLDDCYARMNNKNIGGLVSVIHAEEPVDGEFFLGGAGDWGEERGRGFYAMDDSRLAVAGRLLMHGFSSDSRADIPTGRVLSLTRDSGTGTPDTFWPRVGESYIKKRIREVYSR